ncbi:MAG: YaiI/YqxD family protein [Sulfurospirillum sp.]|nr:YaiI/YqxD family protein [Sulfurospirillum sp.]MBL0702584.1 YaiI/YqxD family protein [Sulfurospirillum sp.]
MTLYVDGDAFPNLLKPILLKAIERLKLKTYVIANKKIDIGKSKNIFYKVVSQGANIADDYIVELVNEGDLVITADIPLADRLITKKAHALDHRGELYTIENVKQCLAMRNFMSELRDSGEVTGGPAPFSKKDAEEFANQLNKFLQKMNKLKNIMNNNKELR